jgi:hypothetical protein
VRSLARHVGVEVTDSAAGWIFNRYRTDAVRAFAVAIPSAPQEQQFGDSKPIVFDRVTQIFGEYLGSKGNSARIVIRSRD